MGVIRALEAAGFEAGDDVEIGGVVFELRPRREMSRYVVKLGSSIVAHDDGAVRVDVLERVCAQVAGARAARATRSSSSARARSPAACA